MRQNLDPFDQYDDATLNDALRAAGLFSLQIEMDEGRITLDTKISSGGRNFSTGQRQILALARAIVRSSKLLILDEGVFIPHLPSKNTLLKPILLSPATSAIGESAYPNTLSLPNCEGQDHKTDTTIQSSLRHELGRDTTIITIAHRLQTIMGADKIVSRYLYCYF